jgi:5-methylcytosine-specific restriction protein A
MVRDAGVDVSDWEASKGRARSAASNPKYCYNWSFVEPGKVVVLNLWHSDLKEQNGAVIDQWNARKIAMNGTGVTVTRANSMDAAIQEAHHDNLPIRVVICEGTQRNRNDPNSNASRVTHRLLDPEPWHVASYNHANGQCTLMRGLGGGADSYMDQFDLPQPEGGPAQRVSVKASLFVRRPEVRRFALIRAKGKCEICDEKGFLMQNGKIYLETHHVIPLHEGGHDSASNVAALCPNHHREAHHGINKSEIREELLRKLSHMV